MWMERYAAIVCVSSLDAFAHSSVQVSNAYTFRMRVIFKWNSSFVAAARGLSACYSDCVWHSYVKKRIYLLLAASSFHFIQPRLIPAYNWWNLMHTKKWQPLNSVCTIGQTREHSERICIECGSKRKLVSLWHCRRLSVWVCVYSCIGFGVRKSCFCHFGFGSVCPVARTHLFHGAAAYFKAGIQYAAGNEADLRLSQENPWKYPNKLQFMKIPTPFVGRLSVCVCVYYTA